ncbi:MAG: hypothetical protein HRF45_01525 [Fimbriimonadia bacterium]|jgi:hypothetical protein
MLNLIPWSILLVAQTSDGGRGAFTDGVLGLWCLADAVAYVRPRPAEATTIRLDVVDTRGSLLTDENGNLLAKRADGSILIENRAFRLVPCDVLRVAKGQLPERIAVLLWPPPPKGDAAILPSSPEGRAVLAFLKRPDSRGYLLLDSISPGVFFYEVRPPDGGPTVVGPLDLVSPLSFWPVGWPVAECHEQLAFRGLVNGVASTLVLPEHASRASGLELLAWAAPARLRLSWPFIPTPDVGLSQVGGDYEAWFRRTIYPAVLSRTQSGDDQEAALALSVLLYNDDWQYMEQFADRVVALTEKSESVATDVIGWLRRAPDPDVAYKKLLQSKHPLVLVQTLEEITRGKRVACRAAVKGVLGHTSARVLFRAMHALSILDNDPDHDPGSGGVVAKIDPGSRAAELLEYWRNKP